MFAENQSGDLGRRIRAARGFAAINQDELAIQLQVSEGYIRQVEGGAQLKPVQARGLTERIAEICDLPVAFFNADFAQLEPGWQPPENQLQRLEDGAKRVLAVLERQSAKHDRQIAANEEMFSRLDTNVQQLTRRLDDLADQASEQLTVGSQRLDAFAAILDEAGKRAT